MTIAPALTQPLRDEHRQLLPYVEMLRSTANLVGATMTDTARSLTGHSLSFVAAQQLHR